MNSVRSTAAFALCCVVGTGAPAVGQTPAADRPSGGVFARRGEATGQVLEVSATLVQAYDDNLLAESGSISTGAQSLGGHYTMLQAGSQYTWASKSVQLGVTGESAFRYYGRVGNVQPVSHAGGLGLSATLARRTTLLVNQSVAYSPAHMFGLFPGVGESRPGDTQPTAPDYVLNDAASYSYATTATLKHGLTRRTSISAAADYTATDFTRENSGRQDVAAHGVRTELSRGVGRHTSVRAGYHYRTGEFGTGGVASATEHGLLVGVDHSRILSASRQAHFGFGFGVSANDAPLLGAAASSGHLYRLVGDATFGYEFGKSWQARAAYRRGLQYIADLTEPVYVGGFTAAVEGLVSRRVDFQGSVGYSGGESALLSISKFDTYTASLRSRLALSRSAAARP
ncbi:MAG: hypothetical protein H0W08_25290 [Acidobacteria bacterium]|nr:hypothetical protein [Acidobacteriota bacterium]